MNYHIIRHGETIFNLAEMYNLSEDAIINANLDIDPNQLMVGQVVLIPIVPFEEFKEEVFYY